MLQALHGESIYNYCVQFSAVWDNVFKDIVPLYMYGLYTSADVWQFTVKHDYCVQFSVAITEQNEARADTF